VRKPKAIICNPSDNNYIEQNGRLYIISEEIQASSPNGQ